MSSMRVRIAVGLLLTLVAVLCLWWQHGAVGTPSRAGGTGDATTMAQPDPASGATAARDRPLQVIEGKPAASGASNPVISPDPLPPDDAILASTYDELVARARRGEAAAARRLYRDVSTCRAQRWQLSLRNDPMTPPARSSADSDADYQQMLQWWRPIAVRDCARARHCAGIEAAQLNDPDRWLLRAAELGDPRARVAFARGELFAHAQSLDSYQLLDRWRQQAVPWLERAVADGDPEALLALGMALSQSRDRADLDVLAQVVPDDPARGYALLYALSQSAGLGASQQVRQRLQDAADRLDVSQRLRARQVGDDLYRQHRRTLDTATDIRLDSLVRQTRPNAPDADPAALAARAPACAAAVDAQLQQALQSTPNPPEDPT